tara:strand:+ start:709 stop:1089 length:381 start_codon:yes stop_codon:yes gene_type:complete
MEIFQVNGEFFTCKDLAIIKGMESGYWITTHDLNETEYLEVERRVDEVFVLDEDSNEYEVTFDLSVEEDEINPETKECVRYHCADNTKIKNVSVYDSGLSEDLKKNISTEVQDVCEYMDEKLKDNE